MNVSDGHRKRVKHYDLPGECHELTFSCHGRRPLLADDTRCGMLSVSMDRAIENHGYLLLAFVYMPMHVHLLVFPTREDCEVNRLLSAIKKPFSLRVKKLLEEQGSVLLDELTVKDRPGKSVFRFWQAGPGYDRNVTTLPTLRKMAEYIHNNPVRKELCRTPDGWRWSSWRQIHEPDMPRDPDVPKVLWPDEI